MLNPGFRWLDPEIEPLQRLQAAAGPAAGAAGSRPELLAALEGRQQEELAGRLAAALAQPGIHTSREIHVAQETLAQELGLNLPPAGIWGWNEQVLSGWLGRFQQACVLVLGILDGEGIWAGCLAGVSGGGLDFLTTWQFFWNDEPELAARQTMHDLEENCRAAGKRFGREARGLFIYRDEFMAWRDSGWSQELLAAFARQATAALVNI